MSDRLEHELKKLVGEPPTTGEKEAALIAHEKLIIDMVLSCKGDPRETYLLSAEALKSRAALLTSQPLQVTEKREPNDNE